MHQMIDGRVDRVLTEQELREILPALAKEIGMTPIGDVVVVNCPVGPSAIQFILESHIAVNYIHRYVTVDIFSCKDFDAASTHRKAIELFHIVDVTKHLVFERGFGKY